MTDAIEMTPEARVLQVIGGQFTPDALGPAYDVIRRAILADPEPHLRVFERDWLGHPDRRVLSDLYLPTFLVLAAPAAPDRVRAIAARLEQNLGKAARAQAAEAREAVDLETADELRRERAMLDERRLDLADLLGR